MARYLRDLSIRCQRGFGLIEMAIVLLIISLGITYAIKGGVSKQDSMSALAEAQVFVIAMEELKAQGKSQGSFSNFTIDNVALAFSRNSSGSTMTSNWADGGITVGAVTPTRLSLQYSRSIPARACMAFIGAIQGSASQIIIQTTAGAAATASNRVKNLNVTPPLKYDAAKAATACNANGGDGLVAADIQIALNQL